ncbi:SURF1 family-domain-containing protein [Polychytrium aggregatum]|uniref:SURF1 family-domain-containing protein n=1 Tax=Polychytrium aggregatum TaxID=110093 RepID=UPI0022FF2E0F|nr:SURF1 family-domain-containing protein [Polychytrium aggregatum]KAI9193123.1 SURF1 family-domain-containing protein [Polychytrium aggregatum]
MRLSILAAPLAAPSRALRGSLGLQSHRRWIHQPCGPLRPSRVARDSTIPVLRASGSPPSTAAAQIRSASTFPSSSRTSGGWLWIFPVITFGLGCWQVYRLQWKLDLIQTLEARFKDQAQPVTQLDEAVSADQEYQRLLLAGEFCYGDEIFIGPRGASLVRLPNQPGSGVGRNPVGYFILTPFQISNGGPRILVNRGWIPKEAKELSNSSFGQVPGKVTIEGIRRSGESGDVMPKNVPDKDEWYWIDLPLVAYLTDSKAILVDMIAGLPSNEPFEKRGNPILKQPGFNLSNNHLSYAITWFGLSLFSSLALKGKFRYRRL